MPPPRNPIIRKKKKPKRYTLPKTIQTDSSTRREKPKAGPPTPDPKKRPAPKRQPGPSSDAERKKVRKVHRSKEHAEARQEARKHGPRRRVGTKRPGGDDKSEGDRARGRELTNRNIRAIRLRVKRKANRGQGVRAFKRELEGRGYTAKLLDSLGDRAAPLAAKAVTKQSQPFRKSGTSPAEKLIERGAKDLINLPAQAIPSVYVPVAGAVEAAKGKPERIKKLAKDIDEHDAIYNLGAAAVEAVGGDSKSAKKRLDRAKKSAMEHPGYAAVEALGARTAIGHGTSKSLRATGKTVKATGRATGSKRAVKVGEKLRKAGSTERAPRRVPGTNIVEKRTYSKDSFGKAKQVMQDRARRKEVRRTREEASREAASGNVERATKLREKAAERDPGRVPAKEVKRRVDERVQVNEDMRRRHRSEATREARKVVKKARREKGALSVVAQRIARADKDDLKTYVRELKAEFETLSPSGKRANKQLRKQIQAVIDDPKADMKRLEATAREYEQLSRPTQDRLAEQGLLGDEQAVKARLIPYAVRNMGGKDFSIAQIREHMAANGVKEPAFLTQAPNQRGARNFNIRSERVQQITGKRTGEATRKGTFDADPETLVEGAARGQGLVDATDGFRAMLSEFGVRGAKTGNVRTFPNRKRAQQIADDLLFDDNGDPNPNAVPMRPVRVNPFAGTKAQLESLLDDVDNLKPEDKNQIVEALTDAAKGKDGDGPWALIPEAAADRLAEHLGVQGGAGGIKTLQIANQAFRKTVLSTSTSWFAGNLIEGLGRAALARSGPRSYATGRKALKRLEQLDAKAYEEALSRLVGGGHFSSADRSHIRRGAEQFAGTNMAPIAQALGKFWRAPGPKQAAELWHRYTDFVFNSLNGRIESGIQTAMLGKALRDSPLMDERVLKLGKGAIDDAAKGLTKTENQVQFGRAVDDMYGRYGKFSPAMRRALSTYTPFAAWAVNAAYFVARTLPKDHPVATAVTAASVNATEEWRKEHGLDLFMDGAVPGFLQGSIPVGKGKLRVSRFTPFGAFGSPTETVAGQFNPLLASPLLALKGLDWTGRELRVKDKDGKSRPANELERAALAARSFGEATIPFLSVGQRVAKDGAKSLVPLRTVAPPEPEKKIKTVRRKPKAPTKSEESFFGGSSGSSGSDESFFGGESSGSSSDESFFD